MPGDGQEAQGDQDDANAQGPAPSPPPAGQECPAGKGDQGKKPGGRQLEGGKGFVCRADPPYDGHRPQIDGEPNNETHRGERSFQEEDAPFHQGIPEGCAPLVFRGDSGLTGSQDSGSPFIGPDSAGKAPVFLRRLGSKPGGPPGEELKPRQTGPQGLSLPPLGQADLPCVHPLGYLDEFPFSGRFGVKGHVLKAVPDSLGEASDSLSVIGCVGLLPMTCSDGIPHHGHDMPAEEGLPCVGKPNREDLQPQLPVAFVLCLEGDAGGAGSEGGQGGFGVR